MMHVNMHVPQLRTAPPEEVLALVGGPVRPLKPFSDEILSFCASFSQAIFRDKEASRHPALVALAFWMRRAELIRLRGEFEKLERPDTIAVPRGLVLHFPPSNVDTIFVYSWLLAALVGNRNLIRISSRASAQSDLLLRLWRESLSQAAPELHDSTIVVSYGHDDEITRLLSAACDVRVIWGGDEAISRIRTAPLAPHARELTFPDRTSLAVLHAGRCLELGETGRAKLAEQFFNDAYWFDQMACSSPRMVIWCGAPSVVKEASEVFWRAVAECVKRKGYEILPAVQMRKLLFSCQSVIDLPVSEYRYRPEATVLELESPGSRSQENCGGGLFLSSRVDRLDELTQVLRRKDQTLAYFGVPESELRDLAKKLGGRAIDRFVPIGQALQFSRFWDGYDLLREFSRLTYYESSATEFMPDLPTPVKG